MITRFASLVLFGGYLFHVFFFNFLNDDAFISFRYALNLAEHGELTYNLGEKVEGYTNFLWTVLMSLVLYLGGDILIWSKALSICFGLGTLLLCAQFLRSKDGLGKKSLTVSLLLILSPAFACWSTGGLETMMFTFFLTLGWLALLRDGQLSRVPRSPIFFAVSALVRPEGILAFGLGMLLLSGRWLAVDRTRKAFQILCLGALLFVAIYGPYFAWRVSYYGWLFPNTYYVKTGATGLWAPGLRYVGDWALTHGIFLLPLSFFSQFASTSRDSQWMKWCGAVFVTVFCIHVAKVGGDFMALHRFLVPVMPICAVLGTLGLARLYHMKPIVRLPAWIKAASVSCILIGALMHVQRVDNAAMKIGSAGGVDSIGWLKMFAKQCQRAGEWLRENADPNESLATTAAGTIPFFSRLYTVDILGLNDEWIAHEVKPKGNRPGHTRSAPPSYLASKAVNYLIYHPQFFETRRRAGGRSLKPVDGKAVKYVWRIEKIHNLDPPYWGFWQKIKPR